MSRMTKHDEVFTAAIRQLCLVSPLSPSHKLVHLASLFFEASEAADFDPIEVINMCKRCRDDAVEIDEAAQ